MSTLPSTSVPSIPQTALASVLIRAHADSGCSGSLTPIRSALVNTRRCGERFKAADGLECRAELIGDMPVTVSDAKGRQYRIVFNNVRYVPDFKFTLLSVQQLWREQRVDARFADINALVLDTPDGELRNFRKLVAGLDAREPTPSSLSTDSQSARDVSYNPQHLDRMKHVQRHHFFIRDMVDSFELEVPFVRTADNLADMFTKPMKNAAEFHKLRRLVMNET